MGTFPQPVVVAGDNPRLHFRGRPTAVTRRIRTVIVDSIQRVLGRAWTHVGGKRGYILAPSVADHYATAAVTVPPLVARIVAAMKHAAPDRVKRMAPEPVLKVPVRHTTAMDLAAEAPTGYRLAVSQITADDGRRLAAVAYAPPRGLPVRSVLAPSFNLEASISPACEIYRDRHRSFLCVSTPRVVCSIPAMVRVRHYRDRGGL
jgi:hypothetical protein